MGQTLKAIALLTQEDATKAAAFAAAARKRIRIERWGCLRGTNTALA
jgi:hypothetical protein